MKDILKQIVASVRQHGETNWKIWENQGSPLPQYSRTPTPLLPILKEKTFVLIAECKQASPSKGIIRSPYDPRAIAEAYASGGAHAISVLCEPHFFEGSLEHLTHVKEQVALPVLRKDFILHPFQIQEAYTAGADMVLLIKKILSPSELSTLLDYTLKLNLTPLIEIFDQAEGEQVLEVVHQLKASEKVILGINNRNLQTFEVDLHHTHQLIDALRTPIPIIGESGIRSAQDLLQLRSMGCAGALVGETLLRAPDCAVATSQLLSEVVKK